MINAERWIVGLVEHHLAVMLTTYIYVGVRALSARTVVYACRVIVVCALLRSVVFYLCQVNPRVTSKKSRSSLGRCYLCQDFIVAPRCVSPAKPLRTGPKQEGVQREPKYRFFVGGCYF